MHKGISRIGAEILPPSVSFRHLRGADQTMVRKTRMCFLKATPRKKVIYIERSHQTKPGGRIPPAPKAPRRSRRVNGNDSGKQKISPLRRGVAGTISTQRKITLERSSNLAISCKSCLYWSQRPVQLGYYPLP
jgi:hypothetical protein